MRFLAAGASAMAGVLLVAALGSPGPSGAPPAAVLPLSHPAPSGGGMPEGPGPALEVAGPSAARSGRPITFELRGAGVERELAVTVDGRATSDVSGGRAVRRLRLSFVEEGWHRLEVAASTGDPTVTWISVGPPSLAAWSGPPGPLADSLREAGFRVVSGFAPDADLIVLSAAPPDPGAIERFVRGGGGALVIGEEAARALGGEPWFPFEPAPRRPPPDRPASEPGPSREPGAPGEPPNPTQAGERKSEDSIPVTLVLVLDRSGSMGGTKLERAKQASVASARTLDPEDLLAVVAFEKDAEVVFPLGRAGDRGALEARVGPLSASGGTRFEPALRLAFEAARSAPAGIRHVVLLSDGMTEDWASADYAGLLTGARRDGVTLSTVGLFGPGERGDEALALLARWGGGRFYPVEDPREIPQVFTLEARRVAGLRTKPPREPRTQGPEERLEIPPPDPPPEPPGPATFSAVPGERHEALAGIDFSSAPTFAAYVRGSAKPRSAAPLRVGPPGDPLLLLRPAGAGLVAVWCADGGEGAFASWVGSGHLDRLGIALAEFLRRADEARPSWRLEAFGEVGLLLDPTQGGGPPPGLAREGRAIDAWTRLVRLDPPLRGGAGPDASGRLSSRLRRVGPPRPTQPAEEERSGPLEPLPPPPPNDHSRLLSVGAALALALAEAARRIPDRTQRLRPLPSRRGGGSAGGGAISRSLSR